MAAYEQADQTSRYGRRSVTSKYHNHLKKAKVRAERRKASRDPYAQPTYGKYKGYET